MATQHLAQETGALLLDETDRFFVLESSFPTTFVVLDGSADGQKKGARYTVAVEDTFSFVSVHLLLTTPAGGSESQSMRVVVYDSSGALVARTEPFVLTGADGSGFREVDLSEPVTLAADNYWLLVHADVPTGPMRWSLAVEETGGVFFENDDTFEDGPEVSLTANATGTPDLLAHMSLGFREVVTTTPFGDSTLFREVEPVVSVSVGDTRYSFAFDRNVSAYGQQGLRVSEARVGYFQPFVLTVLPDAGYDGPIDLSTQLAPWRPLDDNGLRLQVRLSLLLSDAGTTGTTDAYVAWRGIDAGSVLDTALTAVTTSTVTYTATAADVYVLRDSGWRDLDPGYAVADFVQFVYQLQKVGGSPASSLFATVFYRWVG